MNIEEAIKNIKRQLNDTKKANECGLATKGEFSEDIEAIELLLDEYKRQVEINTEHQQINGELRKENHALKEQLQMFIPRRRVRRVYKMLAKILRTDIDPILLEEDLKKGKINE